MDGVNNPKLCIMISYINNGKSRKYQKQNKADHFTNKIILAMVATIVTIKKVTTLMKTVTKIVIRTII